MAQPFLEENPLIFELRTLRESVARFQEEAHASGVKLQRHSLDSARLHERTVHLERENDLLKAELAVLRANPHPDGSSSVNTHAQVQELTLALRKLSNKIESTEDALQAKTIELVRVQADVIKAKGAADGAYELGARVRGREEAALARERHLQNRIVQLEEDARMADVALREYATLVRGMEQRKTPGVTKNGADGLGADVGTSISTLVSESKSACSELLQQFTAETGKLETEIQRLNAELDVTKALLKAESDCTAALTKELGKSQNALEKLKLDDGTAAKMVSRYMQFSQTATNDLLSKLSALKARHDGTLNTLTSQNHILSVQLRAGEAHVNHLLRTLDELGGEIMKETWGRRREIGLRIRMGGREERIVESIRRWVRRGEELLSRINDAHPENEHPGSTNPALEALLTMAQDARILLASLDEGAFDEELGMSLSGGKARLLLTSIQLDSLLEELRRETESRLAFQKLVASNGGVPISHAPLMDKAEQEQPRSAIPSINHGSINVDDVPLGSDDADIPPKVPEKPVTVPVLRNAPSPIIEKVNQEPQFDTTDVNNRDLSAQSVVTSESSAPETPVEPTHVINVPSEIAETPHDSMSSQLAFSTTEDLSDGEKVDVAEVQELKLSLENGNCIIPVKDRNVPGKSSISEGSSQEGNSLDESPPPSLEVPLNTVADNGAAVYEECTLIPTLEQDLDNGLSESQAQSLSIQDTESQDKNPEIPSITVEVDEIPSSSADVSHMTPTSSAPSVPASPSCPDSPSASPFALPTSTSQKPVTLPHPLLDELIHVTKRYDDLQRAFRDCHLALEALKAGLRDSSSVHVSAQLPGSLAISKEILNAALGRLDDYTEDARVELEIRVGDEALLAKGYEALLSVPGAMDTVLSNRENGETFERKEANGHRDVEKQIEDFVSGVDPAVRRARDTFTRKLEDVQHDIAVLKRAIHDPASFSPDYEGTMEPLTSSSSSALANETDTSLASSGSPSGGWASWILNASRPASPASPPHAHGPPPTFGNIMTAPRLRHAPSLNSIHQHSPAAPPSPNPARSRRPSFFGLGAGSNPEPPVSPLAALDLRVPMPSFAVGAIAGGGTGAGGAGAAFPSTYGGILAPSSPLKSGGMPPTARTRTVSSTMYMLGLGAGAGPSQGVGLGAGIGGRMVRAASANGHPAGPGSPLRSAFLRPDQPVLPSPGGNGNGAAPAPALSEEDSDAEEEEDDTDVE